ncbi:MAG TPA: hypothetical protein VMT71_11435 [Syntrophorhabdales bacterium]|nr:hypothetical protein [Syntrophorhabdales bacterium]
MKKKENVSEIFDNDDLLDDIELLEGRDHDRTLTLKAEPRSRRVQLLAQGAKLIRCMCCRGIKPLIAADEFQDGWICEDCIPIQNSSCPHPYILPWPP